MVSDYDQVIDKVWELMDDSQKSREVESLIRDLAHKAWADGRESVGRDMLNPMVNGMREVSENPFDCNG